MTALVAPNSGSVYASDATITMSANRPTWLYLIADVDAAATANIQHGSPAASVMLTLRSASGRQSPPVGPIVVSTCLIIDSLANGDVIALVKV
jgi:hypothetical protein